MEHFGEYGFEKVTIRGIAKTAGGSTTRSGPSAAPVAPAPSPPAGSRWGRTSATSPARCPKAPPPHCSMRSSRCSRSGSPPPEGDRKLSKILLDIYSHPLMSLADAAAAREALDKQAKQV